MLTIDDLTVRYRTPGGTVEALTEVSLFAAKGATLALVGEVGLRQEHDRAGGDRAAAGGSRRDQRTDPARQGAAPPDAAMTRPRAAPCADGAIGMVFQDPFSVLNPSLRIGEQVGEALMHHRGFTRARGADRAVELLDEVGIANPAAVARAYPHQLSGGMKQRALIATALACEPELLILDEPTTALDVTIEAQILDLLEELRRKRGLTMLFISHNLGVVRRIADDVAVLYAGQVVEQGATAAVLQRAAATPTPRACWPRCRGSAGAARGSRRFPAGCPTCALRRRLPLRAALPVRGRRRARRRSRSTMSATAACAAAARERSRHGLAGARRSGAAGARAAARAERADRRRRWAVQDLPPQRRAAALVRAAGATVAAGRASRRSTTFRCHRAGRGPGAGRRVAAAASRRSACDPAPDRARSAARIRIAGEAVTGSRRRARADAARRADRVPEPGLLAQPAQDRARSWSAGRSRASASRPRAEVPARVRPAARAGAAAGALRRPLPAPDERRREAAGRHRPRARDRAALHRLRRAGLGARRLGAGGDRQPARRSARPARRRLPVHLARHLGRRASRRPRRRDVSRQDRRGRRRRRDHDARRQHPYTRSLLAACRG